MQQLPGWYSDAERIWLGKQREQQAKADMARLLMPVADSPETAPGWRDMGMDFSLSEDVAHPRDPAVTKAIQVFDPKLVPLWCRWGFLPPGGSEVVVFGRHAIGRWVDNPLQQKEMILSLVNQVEFIWEGSIFGNRDPRGSDLPGSYMPWDWQLYSFCRQNFVRNPDAASMKDRFIEQPKEAKKKRRKKQAEEQAYIARDLEKFVNKKLEEAGEVEMKNHFLGKKEASRKIIVT